MPLVNMIVYVFNREFYVRKFNYIDLTKIGFT